MGLGEILQSWDFGKAVDKGSFPQDIDKYKQIVQGMRNPWVVVKYNEGWTTEEGHQRVSPRMPAPDVWDYVSKILYSYHPKAAFESMPLEVTLREKDGKRHLALQTLRENREYCCAVYISEQPTAYERLIGLYPIRTFRKLLKLRSK